MALFCLSASQTNSLWICSSISEKRGIEQRRKSPLKSEGVPEADVARGNGVYRPLSESVFRASLAALQVDVSKYTFVDIGSGKGKVLFMAAEHGFERIVGIEYAAGLHATAVRNIASYRSKRQKYKAIEAVHADALSYKLPEGPLVLFTFNALSRETMRHLLEKFDRDAVADPKRPINLIYTNLRTVSEVGNVFNGLRNLQIIRRSRQYLVLANEAGFAQAG